MDRWPGTYLLAYLLYTLESMTRQEADMTKRQQEIKARSTETKRRSQILCECCDPICPTQHGNSECGKPHSMVLHRIDFADRPKVYFCEECASDALDSGLFG